MITREDIQKLATLSRLSLSDEEIERFRGEISSILAYVDKLKAVTGSETGPVMSVNKNIFREDKNPHASGEFTDKLITLAPESKDNFVKVKKILS